MTTIITSPNWRGERKYVISTHLAAMERTYGKITYVKTSGAVASSSLVHALEVEHGR